MSGAIIVTDDLVSAAIYFREEIGARSPGWYCAECEVCDVYTTGAESVVEDWAYEHVFDELEQHLFGVTGAADEAEFYA